MASSIDPPSIRLKLNEEIVKIKQRVETALVAATEQLAKNIQQEARNDISGAGNFGSRWTDGFTYDISGQGARREIVFHLSVPYWRVFQYGAIIHGKPLLWIPLSSAGLEGVSARDFPGRLFRVNRRGGGAPLLMSADDKQVKYTGHEQVRIPKKFHLVEIMHSEVKTLGALYRVEVTSG